MQWAAQLDIHWASIVNFVLVAVGVAIIIVVNWPSRSKVTPPSAIQPPSTAEAPSPEGGLVAALIAVEDHIISAACRSVDLVMDVANSGATENAQRLAKQEVESCLPVLVESTIGSMAKGKFIVVIQKEKERSPDNWILVHTVATRYLFGIAITSMSKKLNELNIGNSQALVELARKVIKQGDGAATQP